MRLNILLLATAASVAVAAPCSKPASSFGYVVKSVSWLFGSSPAPTTGQLTFNAIDDKQTIWEVLNERDEFSKLVRFIKKDEEIVNLLNDKKMGVTLFAPDNDAIDKFLHRRKHSLSQKEWKDDNDKNKFISDSVKYHILPQVLEYSRMGQNSTLATWLHAEDGSFGGHRRRVRIESSTLPPWKVTINHYVHLTETDIRAANGIIHKADAPLFMPPDVMDGLFMLPHVFSTTTTALLKIALQNEYEFNSDWSKKKGGHNDRHGTGSAATTFFAPTNDAWHQLPEDLVFFLFSPMGESTLRKLMGFHTVPSALVFSEWGRDVKNNKFQVDSSSNDEDLSFEWDHHLPSLVDQKLPIHAKKTKSVLPGSNTYNVAVQAHGLYVKSADNVAQNGAIHVLDDVLSPRQKEGIDKAQNVKDWLEWKDWLLEWSHGLKEVRSTA